jgi:hypothetical protein
VAGRRRRAGHDPHDAVVRIVDRLARTRQYVTFADVERAGGRPRTGLPAEDLAALVEGAVIESMLLKDLRTFYDRKTGAYSERWVYRVNPRHARVAEILGDRT